MPSARSAQTAQTARRDGSARAPRSAPRPRPRATALRSSVRRVRWERVARVALLIVLLVVAGLYAEHAASYLSTHSRASTARSAVLTLERENRALRAQQRALQDPSTIVSRARSLGMVRPGEQSYAITGQAGR